VALRFFVRSSIIVAVLDHLRYGQRTAQSFTSRIECSLNRSEKGGENKPFTFFDITIPLKMHFQRKEISASSPKKIECNAIALSKIECLLFMARAETPKRIAVHDQNWHADDCLSVYFLLQTPEFRGAEVVRTRQSSVLATCDAVCDAGGVYDHSSRRYDHHQSDFHEVFPGFMIRLSSCGTIFHHFGDVILRSILEKNGRVGPEIDAHIDFLKETMYREFILEIDASDNGLTQFPDLPDDEKAPPYMVHTGISQRIAMKNSFDPEQPEGNFEDASKMIGEEFERKVLRVFECDVPAVALLEAAVAEREQFGGHVVAFDVACPAGQHIEWAERKFHCEGAIFFYVMPAGAEWAAHAVVKRETGEVRCEFPVELAEGEPGIVSVFRTFAKATGKIEAIQFARKVAELKVQGKTD
jgi:uncharacterized UPF0160 family protein